MPKPKVVESKLDAYSFHGLDPQHRPGDKEAIADCPFCEKEGHFYINVATGQFSCKAGGCGESGNVYSFLQKIHDQKLQETTKREWENLSSLRSGLPWQAFKKAKLAYDQNLDRWLLPSTNGNGKIADLRVWSVDNPHFWSTKGCTVQLYGGSQLATDAATQKPNATIYICEGEWDAIALLWLLEQNEIPQSQYIIVGPPGSSTFKKEWSAYFKGRNVVLLYDNDTAGLKGMEMVTALLDPVAKSLHQIHWPSDATDLFPDKYDIRDFVCDRIKTPKKAWKELQAMIKSTASPITGTAKPTRNLKRTSFLAVIKDFRKAGIHLTDNFIDAILVTIATAISVRVPGDSVWLFLVGPPGSGKTLSIDSFQKCPDHGVFLSKLSAQSLVSGYRTGDGTDPSLLPTLNGKCLFVKDYTAIKAMPTTQQEELYGILRDCYDKHVRIIYGNGEQREYGEGKPGGPIDFSMVAGVTDVIHGDNRATLGERFLKFEILCEDYDPELQIRAAITNVVELIRGDDLVQESMSAFVQHLTDNLNVDKLPTVPQWVQERLIAIAQIAAYLRATVHRTGADMTYRPRPEIGTRLAKQLVKMGRSLAYVLGKKTIDQEVYRLMEKLAFDTVVGWSLEIVRHLISLLQKDTGCSALEISTALQVSKTFINRKLNDLRELRVVEYVNAPTLKPGHPTHLWRINPDFLTLWKTAKVGDLHVAKPKKKKLPPNMGKKYKTAKKKKVAKKVKVRPV